ncbi:MAG: biotin/lipoyl-binding protein [Lachnospiraceae bacterium]|nr:biotin/lipoyl-binding protein [Lachnospiraceae bacterium]
MQNYTITVNGVAYEVTVEEGAGTGAPVAAAPVKAAAPKAAPAKAAAPAAGAGANKIKAPMPGKILGIKVNVGDAVKKGQVMMILEAMKMENEIVADVDGKVASIDVQVGSTVEADDVLASLN